MNGNFEMMATWRCNPFQDLDAFCISFSLHLFWPSLPTSLNLIFLTSYVSFLFWPVSHIFGLTNLRPEPYIDPTASWNRDILVSKYQRNTLFSYFKSTHKFKIERCTKMPKIERASEKELKFFSRMHLICHTLYTIHYTLYTVQYTIYTIVTIHYTLYTLHYTLYTIHYTCTISLHWERSLNSQMCQLKSHSWCSRNWWSIAMQNIQSKNVLFNSWPHWPFDQSNLF